jgi:hypothetical protein
MPFGALAFPFASSFLCPASREIDRVDGITSSDCPEIGQWCSDAEREGTWIFPLTGC